MKMFVLALFFVTLNLCGVNSLKCYQCTSINNTLCGDPFSAFDTLEDCPVLGSRQPELCRKLRQTVDTPIGKILRITRSCGYIRNSLKERDLNCFKASFVAGSSSHYCACNGDNCNSADTFRMTTLIILIITAIIAILNV